MIKKMDEQQKRPMFATTVDYCDDEKFGSRFERIVSPRVSLGDEIRSVSLILKAARQYPLLLLDSSSGRTHPDLWATILMNFWPKKNRPVVIFMGCMWQKDAGVAGWVQKVLIRLADRVIQGYAVQSSGEMTAFPDTWGILRSKIRLCKYFYTLTVDEIINPPPPLEDFVFSGGNSHRDYETLIQAAAQLPELNFVFATKLLEGRTLPSNVKANPVSRSEFMRLMQACTAIVIPMNPGLIRAAGQQTYLNAMFLGKPTIVNDVFGVKDHIVDRKTGLITDGTVKGYVEALRYVTSPENQPAVKAMSENAMQTVRRDFTFDNHAARLIEIVDEFFDAHSQNRL
jgi:glycosyltransferase involved in cell wall biosynthesis